MDPVLLGLNQADRFYPPKMSFQPSGEGYVILGTQTRQTKRMYARLNQQLGMDKIVILKGMVIAGPSRFGERFFKCQQ